MKTILRCLVAAGCITPGLLLGQGVSKTGTVAATFLEIPVGASAVAMGSAFVSLANDATSLYWNPAGSAWLPQTEVLAMHTNWIADTRFDYAAFVLPLEDFGTLGVNVTSLSMDDMKVTTVEKPEGTGEYFSAGDLAVGLSYAHRLTDRFTIGFNAKYIQQTIWHESASAFALDVGTIFRTDLIGGLTIGASLTNFGTPMKMSGRDAREFGMLDPTKQGTNSQIPQDIEMDSWDLPLLFQIGISTSPLKTDNYRLTVSADALHPNDNYESVNVGAEFAFQDILFLRGGYNSLGLHDREGGLSFGFGLSSSSFLSSSTIVRFDYAFRDMGRLSNINVFSLSARF
ncbi:MAG TPA: PorV/PorQ family protein [Bacteroidota bacterium]|nr:PorV/PorQ family protein [Bacteroidota bacterium]